MLLFLCAYPPRRNSPPHTNASLHRLRASARANFPRRKAARGRSCGEAEAELHRRAPFRVRPGSLAAPALAYLILPIDFIKAKSNPLLGWLDEAASIGVLIQKMSNHIPPKSKPAPTPNSTSGSPPTPTSPSPNPPPNRVSLPQKNKLNDTKTRISLVNANYYLYLCAILPLKANG